MDKEIRFGAWIVIGKSDDPGRQKCRCDCGTVKNVLSYELKRGRTTKCKRCCRINIPIGSRFGCYEVLSCIGVIGRQLSYNCRCDCGTDSVVTGARLRSQHPSHCKECRKLVAPIGGKYGQWTVVGFNDINKAKSRWQVRCACGWTDVVNSNNLIRGISTCCYKCKNRKLKDDRGRCFSVTIYSTDADFLVREWDSQVPDLFWDRLNKSASKRGLILDIKADDLVRLFAEQRGRCAYTGLGIHMNNNGRKCTASLDRIDSDNGYSIDNIQFVHKHVNLMKNVFSHDYFVAMCKSVVANLSPGVDLISTN